MKYVKFGLGAAVLLIALIAAGCGGDRASSKFDATGCVYDGSREGGQRLKFPIPPGGPSKKIDGNDTVVYIPSSNRFYLASRDRTVADPGAPSYYIGYAKGQVPVRVEGQIRFRFNGLKPCEWYAQHGRRNEPLEFNARGDATTGWARWLNENFGQTMGQVTKVSSGNYTWQQLVYGTDASVNNTPEEPIDILYGKQLGRVFTQRITANLGSDYFCGTDPGIVDGQTGCIDMYFEVSRVVTDDPELMTEHQKTERLRQQLASANEEAEIRERTQSSLLKSERRRQTLLREQQRTARLEALAKSEVQICLLYASKGLDCEGHRPDVILGGR